MAKFLSFFFFLALLSATTYVNAQELKATVTINAPNLTIIDRGVIEDFESVVSEFLNSTQFTELEFEKEERIECNFTFTVQSEVSEKEFLADLLIQSSRPTFNSNYKSTIINYADKNARIQYEQFQPIEFSQNSFTSSLASLLMFHANLIIGLDQDSFSPLGGQPYYDRAEQIVNLLPSAVSNGDKSWVTAKVLTRFTFMQELLNPRSKPFREMLYQYHLKGLDLMSSDPVAGRAVMAKSLENLQEVFSDIPNSTIVQIFTAAKFQEFIDVFSASAPTERKNVYNILSKVDPIRINKYRTLR